MIKILPKNLRAKIAAGEVIERPCSVVKELIENSIDAYADKISVWIVKGGKKYIKVQDNGVGISEKDIKLAIAPFATSKIDKIEDLYNITSYGFRGEALHSIAEVSKFTIISKTPKSEFGVKLTKSIINDNLNIEKIATTNGTTVIVEDLFYNLPARKKFLKSDFTEYHKILDFILKYALIHPEIEIEFYHNKNKQLHFLKTKFFHRVKQILNIKSDDMIEICYNSQDLKIQGYFSIPKINVLKSDKIYIYINKRPVTQKVIFKSIKEAYKSLIPTQAYPIGVLDLEVNPKYVDCNIHPRKLEVKISNINEIYRLINQLIRAKFKPKILTSIPEKKFHSKDIHKFDELSNYKELKLSDKIEYKAYASSLIKPKEFRILGQIKNCFIVVEKQDGIYIIDQHAASERINLENLKQKLSEKISIQNFLVPLRINLNFSEKELVLKFKHDLEKLGFKIEFFSGNDVLLYSSPKIVKDPKNVFLEIISDLKSEK